MLVGKTFQDIPFLPLPFSFSLLLFPSPSSPASPFVSRNAFVRFSPVLAKKSRNLTGSSVPRDFRASFRVHSRSLQLAAASPTRPWTRLYTRATLSSRSSFPSLPFPSLPFSSLTLFPLSSARNTFLKGSDLTRYDGDVCRKPTAGLSGGSLSVRCRSADPISNWVRSVSKYRTDYVPLWRSEVLGQSYSAGKYDAYCDFSQREVVIFQPSGTIKFNSF